MCVCVRNKRHFQSDYGSNRIHISRTCWTDDWYSPLHNPKNKSLQLFFIVSKWEQMPERLAQYLSWIHLIRLISLRSGQERITCAQHYLHFSTDPVASYNTPAKKFCLCNLIVLNKITIGGRCILLHWLIQISSTRLQYYSTKFCRYIINYTCKILQLCF